MADLIIMCGAPGSGKSTFAKEHLASDDNVIVSRDQIRFSLVKTKEPYFSHEDEVLTNFWKIINNTLKEGKNVIVDQTSLTKKSRKWLLDHVTGYDKVYVFWIKEKISTCLARNEKRKGTRAYVPKDVIKNMYKSCEEPTIEEGFDFIYVLTTGEDEE